MSPRLTRRALLLAAGFSALPAAHARALVRPWPADWAVPALRLPDLHGLEHTLEPLRGQVVVLNFWASWCEPCVAEMPSLLRLAETRANDGVVVLAVNYQEGADKVRRFLDTVLGEVPGSMPVLLDRDGAAAKAWTPRVFPSTVLIDRDGHPRWAVIGELDWTGEQASTLLAPLVAGQAPGQRR